MKALSLFLVLASAAFAQTIGHLLPPACGGRPTANVTADSAFNLGVRTAPRYDVCWLRTSAAKGDEDAVAILGALTLAGQSGIPSNPQEGVRLLNESLEHGSRQAMAMISEAYANGWGGFPRSRDLSLQWEAAADRKGPVPSTPVGASAGSGDVRFQPPRSVPQQPRGAARQAVCDPRNPIRSGDSGYLYRVAHNYPDSSREQACYLRQAAELGEDKAQYEVAESLLTTGNPSSQAEALEWFIKAGDNGIANGYAKAAEMYQKGIGVAANPSVANELYAKAGQTQRDQQFGNAVGRRAIDMLNKVYESNEQHEVDRLEQQGCKPEYANSEQFSSGAALDESETLRKKNKSADALCWAGIALAKGDKRANRQIWIIYTSDSGIPSDPKERLQWLVKAANGGDTRVYYAIGSSYDTGSGVEADPKEAYRWYMLAANNQDPPFNYLAMEEIAKLFRDGRGVARNLRLAQEWADKAKHQEAVQKERAH